MKVWFFLLAISLLCDGDTVRSRNCPGDPNFGELQKQMLDTAMASMKEMLKNDPSACSRKSNTIDPIQYGVEENQAKENTAMFFKMAKGLLEEVDNFGPFVKILAPIAERALGIDSSSDMKIIQEGFRHISSQLSESTKKLEMLIEMDKVRDINNEAKLLLNTLNDVIQANTSIAKSVTLETFLNQCVKKDPTLAIQAMVSLFRQYLSQNQTDEKRQYNIEFLESKLRLSNNNTNKALEELLKMDYWSGSQMTNFVENVMKGYEDATKTEKASRLAEYVFDIHTTDRFCVLIGNVMPLRQKDVRILI